MAFSETFKPKVLIIGSGLAGLSHAAILERAGIPYEIFEKAKELRPVGSAICVGPGVVNIFTESHFIHLQPINMQEYSMHHNTNCPSRGAGELHIFYEPSFPSISYSRRLFYFLDAHAFSIGYIGEGGG